MKIGWLSDIHLNFLDHRKIDRFLTRLAAAGVDSWLISGDIGEADSVGPLLRKLSSRLPGMIYFTLGNHDFYGSSLAAVQEETSVLVRATPNLVWLTETEPRLLEERVALVGDDGWGDARHGDAMGTPVELNDFYLIDELTGLSRSSLVRKLQELGDLAAARLSPRLEEAAVRCSQVVILTHVPPFREAAWYRGKPSDDQWVPWFTCRAMGDLLLQCAQTHPTCRFLVLCGHTHGSGNYSPLQNLAVLTAGAEYGKPRLQRVIDTELLGSAGIA